MATASIPAFDHAASYCYLLGTVLGDGYADEKRPGYWRLQIFQDAHYAGLIHEAVVALQTVLPCMGVRTARDHRQARCVTISVQGRATDLPDLFPQAVGRGPKHLRHIELEDWQEDLLVIRANDQAFLRGLIHSDGSRFPMTARKRLVDGSIKAYQYTGYSFKNSSQDILDICARSLDRQGIRYTTTSDRCLMVRRRADVCRLDLVAGPKW